MKNILFRADSSSTIGTGHIMRDLVLARQFSDANIIFATQNLPGNINHKIEEANYQIEILTGNDLNELVALIKKYYIDMVVIDHYGIDVEYEKALKEQTGIKLFVLDDTYEKHYGDILLNHNIYAQEEKYRNLVPNTCELRCGAEFTLLRNEFMETKKAQKKKSYKNKTLNVFIAMGGADSANLNVKILKVLESFPDLHAHVVTTMANKHLEELKKYVKDNIKVTLHIDTPDIARLMSESDFAIVTPSVTLNEIVYMGLPFLALQTADNQSEMAEYLRQNNESILKTFDTKQLKVGLERLIVKQNTELINFINLSEDEKEMVLSWRNDHNIRQWMLTQGEIELNEHLIYIDSLPSRVDRVYFLVKQNHEAIGVIDFTKIDPIHATVEFGLYAKPNQKGVGRVLMLLIIDYAFRILNVETLIAEVFDDNKVAIGLYKKYGFKEIEKRKIEKRVIMHMELKNENR